MSKKKIEKKKIFTTPVVAALVVVIVLAALIVLAVLTEEKFDASKYTEIKFSQMYETKDNEKDVSTAYKDLDGQKVVLRGYMAEQSPVDESFIYFVSQPYVVCPFCTLGDVTKLDVMYIEMANGAGIKFRNEPVDVYGTLVVEPVHDSFGYTTQFKIVADNIANVEESKVNPQVEAYYAQLNQDDLIFYIRSIQTNLGWFLDLDYLYEQEGYTDDQVIEAIGNQENYDGFKGEVDLLNQNISKLKKILPSDEKLAQMNLELIEIYEKEKVLFEELVEQAALLMDTSKTKEEKLILLDKVREINNRNIELFSESNAWSNKLRE